MAQWRASPFGGFENHESSKGYQTKAVNSNTLPPQTRDETPLFVH
jgi:hypothetical protein